MTAAGITALISIIALLLKAWFDRSPQREKEAQDAKTKQGRLDIANGSVDAVSQRIDSVPSTTSNNSSGLCDDQDTARRLAKITKL